MATTTETLPAEAAGALRARKLRPPMHCYWGVTENCPRNGKITSLGAEGCFIKTKADAGEGQELFVNCWLPTERWLQLRGRVKYRLAKVGFHLTFADLDDTQREMLSMLLEFYGEDSAAV